MGNAMLGSAGGRGMLVPRHGAEGVWMQVLPCVCVLVRGSPLDLAAREGRGAAVACAGRPERGPDDAFDSMFGGMGSVRGAHVVSSPLAPGGARMNSDLMTSSNAGLIFYLNPAGLFRQRPREIGWWLFGWWESLVLLSEADPVAVAKDFGPRHLGRGTHCLAWLHGVARGYSQSVLLKRTALVAGALTAIVLTAGLFPLSLVG